MQKYILLYERGLQIILSIKSHFDIKEAEKVPEIMLEFKSEDLHLEDCSILNISQVKVIHL